MQAVVSLLDDYYYELTEALWRELETQFGLRGVYTTPHPHFSYHVARSYDLDSLMPRLDRLIHATPPFQVRATGLGIFTGKSPVLYIPIVRSPALAQFHRALWSELAVCAAGSLAYYGPEQWLPHITLGSGDIQKDLLAEVVRLLGERDFNWTITVDNLAFVEEDGASGQRLGFKLTFAGGADD
jgi:2'-5' RNA ligase